MLITITVLKGLQHVHIQFVYKTTYTTFVNGSIFISCTQHRRSEM